MNDQIAKHSYLILASFFLSSILNYLYQVVMGNTLPKTEFGILGVSLSIFYIAAILTQNTFSWPAARLISSKPAEASKYFRTALAGNLTLGTMIMIALLLLTFHSETYFIPIVIVAFSVVFAAFANSMNSLIRGFKLFSHIAIANVLNAASKLFIAFFLVILGFGVIGALSGFLISIVLPGIYFLLVVRGIEIKLSRGWSFAMVKETIPVSIIFLSIAFLVNGSIVLFRYLGATDVLTGSFNAALTISRATFFIATALVTVTFPYISSDTTKEYFSFQTLKYVFLFVFPLSLSMTSNPAAWLSMFFSTKYIDATETLRLLALAIGLLSIIQVISSNLVAMEKLHFSSICLLIFSAFFGVLSFIKITSIVILLFLTSLTLSGTFMIYYARNFYFKFNLKYLAKILFSYAVLSLVIYYFPTTSRLIDLLGIIVAFSIYFTIISVLKLFDEDDARLFISPFPENIQNLTISIVKRLNNLT